jgi:hypothetical protein
MKPLIGQGSAHLMWCRGLADWADRPIGRYPFSGRVREHSGQPNKPGLIVDRGSLHGRDLVLQQLQLYGWLPRRPLTRWLGRGRSIGPEPELLASAAACSAKRARSRIRGHDRPQGKAVKGRCSG